MLFHSDYKYTDRSSKAEYVWRKYRSILTGSILDVGADECHLKSHLDEDTSYLGIGLGGTPDRQVDLENGVPFPDNSFDCVLCLDVLEHLENIHDVFDELCRIAKKYVILSLPNPHMVLLNYKKAELNYSDEQHIKFYGLPLEKPADRHRWFFSGEEACRFILYRAEKNGMQVIQLDNERIEIPPCCWSDGLSHVADEDQHCAKNIWAVLKKQKED